MNAIRIIGAACFLIGATRILAECSVTADTATIDGATFSRKHTITAVGRYSAGGMEETWFSKGAAVMRVTMINGRANQDALDFHLLPGRWQEDGAKPKERDWIEVTGQSFGMDTAAWNLWFATRKAGK